MHLTAIAFLLSWVATGPGVHQARDAPAQCEDGRPMTRVDAYGLHLCDPAPVAASRGVLVVRAEGVAAREGMVSGDLIYQVQGRPVEDAAEVAAAFDDTDGTQVLLNFRRGPASYLVRLPAR